MRRAAAVALLTLLCIAFGVPAGAATRRIVSYEGYADAVPIAANLSLPGSPLPIEGYPAHTRVGVDVASARGLAGVFDLGLYALVVDSAAPGVLTCEALSPGTDSVSCGSGHAADLGGGTRITPGLGLASAHWNAVPTKSFASGQVDDLSVTAPNLDVGLVASRSTTAWKGTSLVSDLVGRVENLTIPGILAVKRVVTHVRTTSNGLAGGGSVIAETTISGLEVGGQAVPLAPEALLTDPNVRSQIGSALAPVNGRIDFHPAIKKISKDGSEVNGSAPYLDLIFEPAGLPIPLFARLRLGMGQAFSAVRLEGENSVNTFSPPSFSGGQPTFAAPISTPKSGPAEPVSPQPHIPAVRPPFAAGEALQGVRLGSLYLGLVASSILGAGLVIVRRAWRWRPI